MNFQFSTERKGLSVAMATLETYGETVFSKYAVRVNTYLALFGAAFGVTAANSPFDFDANGIVDAGDFARFGTRFGVSL